MRDHQVALQAAYARSNAAGEAYLATLLSPGEQDQVERLLQDPVYLGLQARMKRLSDRLGGPYGEEQSAAFAGLLKQACGQHADYPWCATMSEAAAKAG
jgi:hypothetical protein